MTPSYIAVKPGDLLAGKYRVERVLGTGAMGVVVSAMHVDLQERRAIKFMLPSMLADKEGVERFLREARSAVRLKSVHVAKIHDIGRLETGAPYMVMELLQGNDLKAVLEHRGALPIPEAVGYMLQVCEAMGEAHGLGIVHRDLKPANLYVTRGANDRPCVKVLDFGIAKLVGNPDGVELTQTSNLMGTPLYMSPEQMRGAQTVDARSDIWALGAILYRLLTNRTPFEGDSVTQICASVVADEPDRVSKLRPEIPPALDAAIIRCLEKDAARRFQSVAELASAIAPFADPSAITASSAVAAPTYSPPGPAGVAPPAAAASAPRDLEGSLSGSSSGSQPRAARPKQKTSVGVIVGAVGLVIAGGAIAAFVMTRGSGDGVRSSSSAHAKAEPTSSGAAERSETRIEPATSADVARPAASAAPSSSVATAFAATASAPSAAASTTSSAAAVAPALGPPPSLPGVTPPTKSPSAQPGVSYDERY